MNHSISVIIRKADIEDIKNIMKIEHLAFHSEIIESEKTFEDRTKAFEDGFLVAETDANSDKEKEIVGYISSELWEYSTEIPYENFALNHSVFKTHKKDGNELYISSVAVDPAVRGKNIGKRLLEELLKTISEKYELKSSILIVNSEWKNAFEMYRKKGFEEVAQMPDFFPKSDDPDSRKISQGTGIIMRKGF